MNVDPTNNNLWPVGYQVLFKELADQAHREENLEAKQIYTLLSRVPNFMHGDFGKDYNGMPANQLDPIDIAVLEAVALKSRVPEWRALLYDFLWYACRKLEYSDRAIAAYVVAISNSTEVMQAKQLSSYAIRQANFHRKVRPKWRMDVFDAVGAVIQKDPLPKTPFVYWLVLFLQEHGQNIEPYIDVLKSNIIEATYETQREKSYKILSLYYQKKGKQVLFKQHEILRGESLVKQAKERAQLARSSDYAAGAFILAEALEILESHGIYHQGDRRLLRKFQQKGIMNSKLRFSYDVSDEVRHAISCVSKPTLEESLAGLLQFHTISTIREIEQRVSSRMEYDLSQALFPKVKVDNSGRTITKVDTNSEDLALQQLHLEVSLSSGIMLGAVDMLNRKHQPSLEDFKRLVNQNCFVPLNRREQFARGLYAGVCGDFMTSGHFLAPQLEPSMRHVLESHGYSVTSLQAGTERVNLLTKLLEHPGSSAIFGEKLCFELRCCFNEKVGFNLRNLISHGEVTDEEFISPAPGHIHLWWLMLYLCINGKQWGPSEEAIRKKAYTIWESQGKPLWREQEHWHQAEQELLRQHIH